MWGLEMVKKPQQSNYFVNVEKRRKYPPQFLLSKLVSLLEHHYGFYGHTEEAEVGEDDISEV